MENYFIEEDFIELRDSVKNLIDVIEKYKNNWLKTKNTIQLKKGTNKKTS